MSSYKENKKDWIKLNLFLFLIIIIHFITGKNFIKDFILMILGSIYVIYIAIRIGKRINKNIK